MTTSLVVPIYNGEEYIKKNARAWLKCGVDEVIVVDDASTDNSLQIVADNFPEIKIVKHSHNQRFPKTANDGFLNSKADIVFLINQDTEPLKNLVASTLPLFHDKSLFAVTFNESGRSWAKARMDEGLIHFYNGELDDQIHNSFWASGGSAAFRKSIWDKLGGFDLTYSPGYYEDLDLGYRAWKRGYKIIWNPKSHISHPSPESAFRKTFSAKRIIWLKERNYILTHLFNVDTKNLYKFIFKTISKVLSHPGYIVPTLMASKHLFTIISRRQVNSSETSLTDEQVFINFV